MTLGGHLKWDASGSAYVADKPSQLLSAHTTAEPFKPLRLGGAGDAFVANVSPAGTSLHYSTYLGGSGTTPPRAVAVDSTGNAFDGQTYSTDFPTSARSKPSLAATRLVRFRGRNQCKRLGLGELPLSRLCSSSAWGNAIDRGFFRKPSLCVGSRVPPILPAWQVLSVYLW